MTQDAQRLLCVILGTTDETDFVWRLLHIQAGLVGDSTKVVWVGNIPEATANDTSIRLLFGSHGDIRRVYMRRKKSPSMSWCLLMFRASESATAALKSEAPVVADSDGNDVSLIVELPNLEKELTLNK